MNYSSQISRLLFCFFIAVLIVAADSNIASAARLGRQLQNSLIAAADDTELPVIVTFKDKVIPAAAVFGDPKSNRNNLVRAMRQQAKDSQQELKNFLRQRDVTDIKSLWIINGLAIKARPELVRILAQWPGVVEVKTNGVITVPEVTYQAVGTAEWNITAVGAPELWTLGLTGQGVVIASFDTGVDINHPDLANWRGGTNSWFDPYTSSTTPYDKAGIGSGHGTAVMGIMVGGDADGTSIGVAPDATWIAAKIFDDAGSATYSAIHLAYQWVLDPDNDVNTDDAPDIVNNSWGLEAVNECITEFQPDIQALKTAGIAVVFSGGNSGPDPATSISPANYPESLAIGATDQNGALGGFSSRGPSPCPSADLLFPQISAPGIQIRTADLSLGGTNPDPYAIADGSSFAAPHVSGIMALLLEPGVFPGTSIPDLEEALKKSADDLGIQGPDNGFGHGLVNGLAAYRRLSLEPHLTVYEPTSPENDRLLDFGSIPVNTPVTRTIEIRNSGGGNLTLGPNNWTGLAPPFTVISNTCNDGSITLAPDDACQLTVQFSPSGAGDFSDTLNFFSDDPDESQIDVSLTGTGNSDPTPPLLQTSATGGVLDFGSVAPGKNSGKTLTITNTGDELLTINHITIADPTASFSIISNNCSPLLILAGNETCTVDFGFGPAILGDFQADVDIFSDNSVEDPVTVSLVGKGNNPPSVAMLLAPLDGATNLDTTVTFQWTPTTDPDGDPVTETVLLSESTGPAQQPAFLLMNVSIFNGVSGNAAAILLVCSLIIYCFRRRLSTTTRLVGLLAAGILLLNACSRGGSATPMSASGSFTATNLKSGTTYFWKVVSDDGKGGTSESATWSFTTS